MQNIQLQLAAKLWALHEQHNVIEKTRLGTQLFWQLLKSLDAAPYNLTIKLLNCDVDVATSALRNTLRRLERDGWIRICSHPDDRRVRCVQVTQKFMEVAKVYFSDMDKCFTEYHQASSCTKLAGSVPTARA